MPCTPNHGTNRDNYNYYNNTSARRVLPMVFNYCTKHNYNYYINRDNFNYYTQHNCNYSSYSNKRHNTG